jgi:hypothetical protein
MYEGRIYSQRYTRNAGTADDERSMITVKSHPWYSLQGTPEAPLAYLGSLMRFC